MIARINAVINTGNFAGFIDQDTDTGSVSSFRVIACPVRHPDFAIGVAEQGEIVVILFGKCGVVFDRIKTGAQNYNVALGKVALLVAEPAPFDGSARGVRFGIEPQQDFSPAQLIERKIRAFMCFHSKICRYVSNLRHHFAKSPAIAVAVASRR